MRDWRTRISQSSVRSYPIAQPQKCATMPGYPWRSFSARITSMKASVMAEEPISGQSGSAAP